MSHRSNTSISGIATTASGERLIPASVRADGSVRKEIRVRQGFKPAEDVELYKNRTAAAFKNRGKTADVPGAELVHKPLPRPAQKREKAAANKGEDAPPAPATAAAPPAPVPAPVDPEAERDKEAKKLSKKLRQARELQKKKSEGGALLPEQFEKVIRINELIRQLDALGFDQEGVKKN